MIPVIQKILYATDLSDNSAHAFRYAASLAKFYHAEIVILHVLEGVLPGSLDALNTYLGRNQLIQVLKEDIEKVIFRTKNRLRLFCERELKHDGQFQEKDISIEVYGGYPAEEILKKTEELNCDVIIMGTHGKGVLRHTFLGSVAEKVLQRSKIPVFVVPIPRGETSLTFHD